MLKMKRNKMPRKNENVKIMLKVNQHCASQKGITLMALVVTVIVLLILARDNYYSFNW